MTLNRDWEHEEFNPDDLEFIESDTEFEPDYFKRRISEIPVRGDAAREKVADYLDLLPDLARDGTLTDAQREVVDTFIANNPL